MPNGNLALPEEQEPTFRGVLDAVLRRIRLGQRGTQQRISQAVRTAGLRTSGVGQIPLVEAERGRQLAEAGAVAGLGQQRLGQLGSLERLRQSIEGQLRILREQGQVARGLERERASGALRRALIGGGAAFGSGFFRRRRVGEE